jgi:predicted RNA-binding Zn ribbon-like protein
MTGDANGPASRAGTLPLVGGALALDFCNTSSGRGTDGHIEHLRTAADLLTWAHHAAVLDHDEEAWLRQRCATATGFGKRLLAQALRLRDAIYRLDVALSSGPDPDQADVDLIAGLYANCLMQGHLRPTREGSFGWSWDIEEASEATVLGPIAASAMALITAADRARLKQCEGHHCGWLFLDTTKSNNRRWCEMEVCGNRAKQRRRRIRPA